MRFEFTGTAQEVIARLFSYQRQLVESGETDEPLFEVKLWKAKRSLTQNAYYWALIGKLGAVLGVSSERLHVHMLREYGAYDVFTVREDVPLNAYFRYYDKVGEGYMDGVRYVHIRAFKGSSEMDSTEFSKLLNGAIQECEQQGIDTMTPEEVSRLRWAG